MQDMATTPGELPDALDEIGRMARADHAYGMTASDNPYPPATPQGAAWSAGFAAEAAATQPLDEAMSKLPEFRVVVHIVEDGEGALGPDGLPGRILEEIPRDDWRHYTVGQPTAIGERGVTFRSREARQIFPERNSVVIRAEYLTRRPR